MNPAGTGADPATVHHALSSQGSLLGQHDQLIRALVESNQSMAHHVSELACQISALTTSAAVSLATPSPVFSPTPRQDFPITDPEPFHGEVEKCRGFLFQCNKVFRQRPVSFAADVTRINYVLSLLRGKALTWAEALSSSVDYDNLRFECFSERFSAVFDHPNYSGSAENQLLGLQQGNRSVAEYSIEFHTLAAEARWDEAALKAVFLRGLKDQLRDELAARDVPADLQDLISLVSRLDCRLRERRAERTQRNPPVSHSKPSFSTYPVPSVFKSPSVFSPPSGRTSSHEEAMQLGRARLSPEERQRRACAGQCMYCGNAGHVIANCPVRPNVGARQ